MSWFPSHEFARLEITQHPSLDAPKVSAHFETEDAAAIAQIKGRISALPAAGDKMKSFSKDAVKTTLQFFTAGKKDVTQIEIYNGHFKTPSTGFNSEYSDAEKNLNADLETLLRPALKKKLLKISGLSVEVPEGKVTFKGNVFKKNDEPGMPTIGPTNEDLFEIENKKGERNLVKVYSGQNPPSPLPVKIGEKNYTINTFKSSTGDSLYDNYFEVSK